MTERLIFVPSSWTWFLSFCDAPAVSARRLRAVGRGPFVLHDTQCRGHGQSQRRQTRQKIQPDGSSDSHLRLWDPALHPLYHLQGDHYG